MIFSGVKAIFTTHEGSQIVKLLHVLNNPKIDLEKLRECTMQGLTEKCKGLRSVVWRILLGHLPNEPAEWLKFMEKSKKEYEIFKKELIVKPQLSPTDHPLSQDTQSKWNNFFKDKQTSEEILNDIKRTRPEIPFVFSEIKPGQPETHGEVLTRILFLYTKLNPGIKYVQGMNEIMMMLYYTIYEDTLIGYEDYIESESFYAFSRIMGEVQNNFIRALDKTIVGVKMQLDSVSKILKRVCPEVWKNLKVLKIEYEFFALRWVILLLSQEFNLKDTQKLWDCLLADKNRFTMLQYFIVGILVPFQKELQNPEFSEVMHTLQNAPKTTNIDKLKKIAIEMYVNDLSKGLTSN